MNFEFIDSVNESYYITFGLFDCKKQSNSLTIVVWPSKYDYKSLAMSSFEFSNQIIINSENDKWWVKEHLSNQVISYINSLIKNKVFL